MAQGEEEEEEEEEVQQQQVQQEEAATVEEEAVAPQELLGQHVAHGAGACQVVDMECATGHTPQQQRPQSNTQAEEGPCRG